MDAKTPRKFHVVLHGLMVVRFHEPGERIELVIPQVGNEHVFRLGSFCDLRKLGPGLDYHLENVARGTDSVTGRDQEFVVIRLQDHPPVKFPPNSPYIVISLPCPEQVRSVRKLVTGATPLFVPGQFGNASTYPDPRQLGYITVLTYSVQDGFNPTIYKGDKVVFWSTEALDKHNRLHVFAEPECRVDAAGMVAHTAHAYPALNALFHPVFDLKPNIPDPASIPKFDKKTGLAEIPDNEAVDLGDRNNCGAVRVEGSGNCLQCCCCG